MGTEGEASSCLESLADPTWHIVMKHEFSALFFLGVTTEVQARVATAPERIPLTPLNYDDSTAMHCIQI